MSPEQSMLLQKPYRDMALPLDKAVKTVVKRKPQTTATSLHARESVGFGLTKAGLIEYYNRLGDKSFREVIQFIITNQLGANIYAANAKMMERDPIVATVGILWDVAGAIDRKRVAEKDVIGMICEAISAMTPEKAISKIDKYIYEQQDMQVFFGQLLGKSVVSTYMLKDPMITPDKITAFVDNYSTYASSTNEIVRERFQYGYEAGLYIGAQFFGQEEGKLSFDQFAEQSEKFIRTMTRHAEKEEFALN